MDEHHKALEVSEIKFLIKHFRREGQYNLAKLYEDKLRGISYASVTEK